MSENFPRFSLPPVDFLTIAADEVEADITTDVISIKNPKSGTIRVPHVQEIIMDDPNAKGQIIQGEVQ